MLSASRKLAADMTCARSCRESRWNAADELWPRAATRSYASTTTVRLAEPAGTGNTGESLSSTLSSRPCSVPQSCAARVLMGTRLPKPAVPCQQQQLWSLVGNHFRSRPRSSHLPPPHAPATAVAQRKLSDMEAMNRVEQRFAPELANVGDCPLLLVLTLTTEQHWGLVNNIRISPAPPNASAQSVWPPMSHDGQTTLRNS